MIKYRGGKSKEISHFISNMPEHYNRYIEPFFGGGALYFYLEPQNAIINDVNTKLYSFYKQMQEEYPSVRKQLDELQMVYEQNQKEYEGLKKKHPEEIVENKNEALYYKIRDMFNHKIESEYLEAVVYFFINKTAYSGMIRYNAKGEYNVPFGRYKNLNTKLKKETGKDAYCLFIAPKINESCIAYFYALHTMNIAFYGGKSVIVPLELDVFINMVEQSYKAGYVPNPQQVKSIFEYSLEQAKKSADENEWYAKVKEKALNWLG